jgi:hypothetical protein
MTSLKIVNSVYYDESGSISSELLGHIYQATLRYKVLLLPATAPYFALAGNNNNNNNNNNKW